MSATTYSVAAASGSSFDVASLDDANVLQATVDRWPRFRATRDDRVERLDIADAAIEQPRFERLCSVLSVDRDATLPARHNGNPDQFVQDYAAFLLRESGAYHLPVQLDRVGTRFDFPVHRQQLATDQRGFTTSDLRICLNANDLPTMQKFTLAHEFVEVLFFALKEGYADHWMSDGLFTTLCDNKERYCDRGAAEIVLPMSLFAPLIAQALMSLQRAQEIAASCSVSLMATLWRIIETGLAPVVLIIWRHKHKPTQFVPSQVGQGNLFGPPEALDPPKKMRVDRVFSPPGTPFIPPDKSVSLESSVQRAFLTGRVTSGHEQLDLVGIRGRYFV